MRKAMMFGLVVAVTMAFLGEAAAQQPSPSRQKNGAAASGQKEPRSQPLTLADASQQEAPSSGAVADHKIEEEIWDIGGPIRLRSADAEPPGELVFKNIFDYSTSSDGSDDDLEYEFEIEYGIAPNHELIFEVPVQLGDGGVDGNADITVGHHWQLWKEQDLLPAFALRNYLRVPSGYKSSGVDWELRGLLTKSIIPHRLRLHLNPFLKSVNGDNVEDVRRFQWGAVIGADYRINDRLVLNCDYVHETGETEGSRNQHTAEVGLEWLLAPHHEICFVTRAGLDGDSQGENWGCAISYIYEFEGLPYIGMNR